MGYRLLKFEELIEFLGTVDKKIDVKVNGKLLTINSYQAPTNNIKELGLWIECNLIPLKTCRFDMTSWKIKSLYKEHTGKWCSRSDVKIIMEMLGFEKRQKGTEDYYYNCKLI